MLVCRHKATIGVKGLILQPWVPHYYCIVWVFSPLHVGVGFLKNPQDITKHEHQNATFHCFGTGELTLAVTWFFNGMQLQSIGNTKYSIPGFGDSNFGALTIFNLVYDDHGTYTCIVSNGFKAINDSAILKVQGR